VRNRVHYFGPWADPDAALAVWLKQKDDLLAGREPENVDGWTLGGPRPGFTGDARSGPKPWMR